MAEKNHRWGDPSREERLTTRVCVHCGTKRLTIHEGAIPETAFERNGVRTNWRPPCVVTVPPAESA